jgi:hypothetical protein
MARNANSAICKAVSIGKRMEKSKASYRSGDDSFLVQSSKSTDLQEAMT